MPRSNAGRTIFKRRFLQLQDSIGGGVSLFALVLLVGIGKTFLDDYYIQMSGGFSLKEMSVLMVISIVLLVLVDKIPPMLSSIVGGGAGGIGNLGAGAAIAAAATATGVATGMMMASAANAAGGASAIKAAFDAAHASMEGGMGMFAEEQSRQSTPLGGLAQAMGTPPRFVAEWAPTSLAVGWRWSRAVLPHKEEGFHKLLAEK